MVQYESACIERELWRERERKLGGLWDAGDSPNVDALCFDHTDEDAGSADWCRICVAPRRDGVCYAWLGLAISLGVLGRKPAIGGESSCHLFATRLVLTVCWRTSYRQT